jgi:hypothetical protein
MCVGVIQGQGFVIESQFPQLGEKIVLVLIALHGEL